MKNFINIQTRARKPFVIAWGYTIGLAIAYSCIERIITIKKIDAIVAFFMVTGIIMLFSYTYYAFNKR